MMIACPHCTEARRQKSVSTAPICCLCNGAFVIEQTWSLVWAWDYRGCDCQACSLLREMRPFTMRDDHIPCRPDMIVERLVDPEPMTCRACGKGFTPWPEGLVQKFPECGPCFRTRVNLRRTVRRRARKLLLRRTA